MEDAPQENEDENAHAQQTTKLILDPRHDKDYTLVHPDGQNHRRGTEYYDRPYGWKRYGLKVLGRYEDDTWLGAPGGRKQSSPGEWPVAYIGTTKTALRNFGDDTSLTDNVQREYDGQILCAPSIRMAERLAKGFKYDGECYKCVLQIRIHPDKKSKSRMIDGNEVWLVSRKEDIRPYGILLKELSTTHTAIDLDI